MSTLAADSVEVWVKFSFRSRWVESMSHRWQLAARLRYCVHVWRYPWCWL